MPPLVSVVISAYRRVDHLRRTLESFLAGTRYRPLELILTDDGSPSRDQISMRTLPFDVFLFSSCNQGLGYANNRALKAARGDYILHLQDDWNCVADLNFLEESIQLLSTMPTVDVVRFTTAGSGLEASHRVETPGGQMVRLTRAADFTGTFLYSDNPHLKRRDFHDRHGYFSELPGIESEPTFCKHILQNHPDFTVAWIPSLEDAFLHTGDDISFRPDRRIERYRKRLERSLPGRIIYRGYDRLPAGVRTAVRTAGRQALER